jgi:hypothetical protein
MSAMSGRLRVTAQMIADLVILGLTVKVIVGAAKRGESSSQETRTPHSALRR